MDKVKQILEQLRKHHFWILCGIAALVGVAAWYLSSGKLQAEFTQNATRIESEIKKVDGITDTPKDGWKDSAERHKAAVQLAVKSARDTIYLQQKDEVFTWPKELGDDFIEAVTKIEGTSEGLSVELRERYLDWVKSSVRTLAKTVDAAMPDEAQALVGGEFGTVAPEHKVLWPSITQIQQTFDWEQRPSTLLVKYAQEELWVYQTLCNIIAVMNKGSHGAHDAAVKDIISMDIAYLATDLLSRTATKGRIQSIATASMATPTADASAAVPVAETAKPNVSTRGKRDTAAETAAPSADAAAPSADRDQIWRTFRYVDEKGDPKTAAADEKPEYYLMPFRLLLKMDRRSIDKLLLECRNSKLPIEVQQVRINPSASTTSVGMGGGGGGGAGHSEADAGPGAGAVSGKQYDRYATVELRGIVYLLQPEPKAAPESATPENTTDAPPADNAGADTPAPAPVPAGNGE
jgi:hypothetical protein